MTALLIALIIGAAAGWLAAHVVQGTGFGLIGDILIGIAGALIAALLFTLLGAGLALGGGVIGSIIVATIGAVILLLVVRAIRRAMA